MRDAVRRDGQAYVQHLDSFIVALREELDSPGGLSSRNPPSEERKLYRMDVKRDGTGIESPGWFRASNDTKERNNESMVSSRLCALHWVIVLYESVVPDALKAEYAREFIIPIISQLINNPPERIVFKSLEVLAKITVPVVGEERCRRQSQTPPSGSGSLSGFTTPPPSWALPAGRSEEEEEEQDLAEFPMTDANIVFALDILHPNRRKFKSRDREVFTALIQLHSYNQQLLADLSSVIAFMCSLQPPEFVFVSFAVELDRFVKRMRQRKERAETMVQETGENGSNEKKKERPFSDDLEFVSSFVQQMCHVLLNAEEAKPLRDTLCDCVGSMQTTTNNDPKDLRRVRLFHILLQSFSHSVVATVSLCLWGGAYRTAATFLESINELDINLMFLLELDKLVEQLEKPLFRHVHIRMLEKNEDSTAEGSGAMLFKTLKYILMILPQSTCFSVLKDRLVGISRFRQSTSMTPTSISGERHTIRSNVSDEKRISEQTDIFVSRVLDVRAMHCDAMWQTIRSESLETRVVKSDLSHEEGSSRREWLGYGSKEEDQEAQAKFRSDKESQNRGESLSIEEIKPGYEELKTDDDKKEVDEKEKVQTSDSTHNTEAEPGIQGENEAKEESAEDKAWKEYWANN